MIWESCGFGYTEHKKIEFAIFRFFYDFKSNLQVSAITHKGVRIFIHLGPWNYSTSQLYPRL
jgi:hypothetical protein